MALYAALRRQKQIAGVAAFSGFLPEAGELRSDIRSRPPVLLVHGDAVPLRAMISAQAMLAAQGVLVKAVARRGLGHVIDEEAVAIGAQFLQSAFKMAQDTAGKAV